MATRGLEACEVIIERLGVSQSVFYSKFVIARLASGTWGSEGAAGDLVCRRAC